MASRLSSARHQFLFGLLVAFTLAVRLLVPIGWMPEADAAGIRLEWCGRAGPPPAALEKAMAEAAERLAPQTSNDKNHHGQKSGADQTCAFAGLAFPALPPTPLPYLAPLTLIEAPRPPELPVAVGRGLAAPPPPSTGPPALI